jgi:hypothetical protein
MFILSYTVLALFLVHIDIARRTEILSKLDRESKHGKTSASAKLVAAMGHGGGENRIESGISTENHHGNHL